MADTIFYPPGTSVGAVTNESHVILAAGANPYGVAGFALDYYPSSSSSVTVTGTGITNPGVTGVPTSGRYRVGYSGPMRGWIQCHANDVGKTVTVTYTGLNHNLYSEKFTMGLLNRAFSGATTGHAILVGSASGGDDDWHTGNVSAVYSGTVPQQPTITPGTSTYTTIPCTGSTFIPSSTTGYAHQDSRWRLYSDAGLTTLVEDSDWTASYKTTYTFGSTVSLEAGTQYWVTVTYRDVGDVESSPSYSVEKSTDGEVYLRMVGNSASHILGASGETTTATAWNKANVTGVAATISDGATVGGDSVWQWSVPAYVPSTANVYDITKNLTTNGTAGIDGTIWVDLKVSSSDMDHANDKMLFYVYPAHTTDDNLGLVFQVTGDGQINYRDGAGNWNNFTNCGAGTITWNGTVHRIRIKANLAANGGSPSTTCIQEMWFNETQKVASPIASSLGTTVAAMVQNDMKIRSNADASGSGNYLFNLHYFKIYT